MLGWTGGLFARRGWEQQITIGVTASPSSKPTQARQASVVAAAGSKLRVGTLQCLRLLLPSQRPEALASGKAIPSVC